MGEAMLFPGRVGAANDVQLGPLRLASPKDIPQGPVKVAVRPEAWVVGPPGSGLNARLAKASYLGSTYEYTFQTELGPIFVVSSDLDYVLPAQADVGLSLADHGVCIVCPD